MSGGEFPNFDVTFEDGVAVITIARPEKLNALNTEMVDALIPLCRFIERRKDVFAVILTGQGKAFCAGGDIEAWSGEEPEDFGRHWVREGHMAFDALARLRQPLIAVLNGHALGGGLELAACADYRIAEAHIRVGQPETGLGIIPGWSGTQRAVRRFGARPVRRMALFGEVFHAGEALALGIVDRVVPTGEGMTEAKALAANVLQRGGTANELTKMLINTAETEEGGRVLEALAGRIAADTPELSEGLASFREKRKPDFRS
jgi:enoyl-CoA hydratase/carnithine racemase